MSSLVPSAWPDESLQDSTVIGSGSAPGRKHGDIVVMGANGPIGWTDRSNFEYGYLVGRVGAVGAIQKVTSACWASDNTLTLRTLPRQMDFHFLGHLLVHLEPSKLATQTAQPLLTQSNLGPHSVPSAARRGATTDCRSAGRVRRPNQCIPPLGG